MFKPISTFMQVIICIERVLKYIIIASTLLVHYKCSSIRPFSNRENWGAEYRQIIGILGTRRQNLPRGL